jgi:DNA-binding LytR/AlgR family response regulator
MIKIAICDDDKNILDITYNILFEGFSDCVIKKYTDSKQLLDKVMKYDFFDIYILDIEMPEVSGVEVIKAIRKYQHNAVVMFLTGYAEYAVEAYEFGLFRYILKKSINEKLVKNVREL